MRRRMLLARGKKYLKNYTIFGNSLVKDGKVLGVGDVQEDGTTSLPIVARSRNLISMEDIAEAVGGVYENGVIKSSVGAKGSVVWENPNTESIQVISLSYTKNIFSRGIYFSFFYTDGTSAPMYYWAESHYVNTSAANKVISRIGVARSTFDAWEISDVQIEIGTPTPYVPYRKDTYPLTIPSPLHKVGDVADVLDYNERGVARNIGVKVFNGSEGWYDYGKGVALSLASLYPTMNPFTGYLGNALMDMYTNFPSLPSQTEIKNEFTIYHSLNVSWIVITNGMSASQFKDFLSSHPLKLYFWLANTTFEPLDLPKIESFDGIQLTTDTEVLPSKVEIEL